MLGDVIGSVALLALEVCCEQKKKKIKPVSSVSVMTQHFKPLKNVQFLQILNLPVFALERKVA